VVCLGLIVDERGRKMSKHLGNVLEPIPLMESHGADAVRWFFAASGSPWATRKIGPGVLEEIVRKVLLTYWNTASFFVLYANADAGFAAAPTPAPAARPLLDRWLLSELHALVRDVTAAMESFDSPLAGRRIAGFIDDLSNWYVRRSRRRFWLGTGSLEGASAFATLRTALDVLTRLMAPITPFLTDYVWNVLRPADSPESVHLARWPVADTALIDTGLAGQMALVRRLVELGRSARSAASVKVRQPLGRALVSAAGFASLPAELLDQIGEELNVRAISALDGADGQLVSYSVRPNYRTLGKRFGSDTQPVAAAVDAADPAELATQLSASGSAQILVAGVPVTVGPDDVVVTQTPRAGWTVASEAGETVALEVTITPELRREGLAREVVRLLQEARRSDDLDLADRVMVRWSTADPELAAAITEHAGLIAGETLAVDFAELRPDAADAGGIRHAGAGLPVEFWLQRAAQPADADS
jgi:isoleucyl-tRNA synthetase